jgi:prepilin signal peptidase PulO-like enzyme (type II secretory pathway)
MVPGARRPWSMAMLRNILLVIPIAAVFVFAVYYMLFAWNSPGDVDMHPSGYIAMTLGVVVSFALAAVLIALLLHRNPDEE